MPRVKREGQNEGLGYTGEHGCLLGTGVSLSAKNEVKREGQNEGLRFICEQ